MIDELPTLNRLRDLETFLQKAENMEAVQLWRCKVRRKWMPFMDNQIPRQSLETVHKIVFAEQNPINAARIAEIFGEQEIKKYQKGLSYGANDIRDGVNLSQQVRQKPLITKTDIQFLKRNHAFIRLPENYPIVKVKMPIIKQKESIC